MALSRPPQLGSRAARVELVLAAFAPAFVLMTFRARDHWIWVGFAGVALLGLVCAAAVVIVSRRSHADVYSFKVIQDAGGDLVGHVGSYLLAVVVDVSGPISEIVIAGAALALIVQIHVAMGRVAVNPLLSLFGFRVYASTSSTDRSYWLIARSDVALWGTENHELGSIGSSILIEKRRRNRP